MASRRCPTIRAVPRFDWPSDAELEPAPRSTGTTSGLPPPAPACEALAKRAREHVQKGQNAAAHVAIEQAYACQPHPSFVPLAFMTACTSNNSNNAKAYYGRLTPDQQARFAQLCIRQQPPVAYQ